MNVTQRPLNNTCCFASIMVLSGKTLPLLTNYCPACNLQLRWLKKFTRIEDPQLIKRMPVMQYVGEKSAMKRSKHVYSWGLAVTGALGNPNFLQPTPTGDKKRDKKLMLYWKPLEQFSKPQKIKAFDEFNVSILS